MADEKNHFERTSSHRSTFLEPTKDSWLETGVETLQLTPINFKSAAAAAAAKSVNDTLT